MTGPVTGVRHLVRGALADDDYVHLSGCSLGSSTGFCPALSER